MAETDLQPENSSEGGKGQSILAFGLVVLLSVGGGLGLAWHSEQTAKTPTVPVPANSEMKPQERAALAEPTTKITELPSIMTNLSGEGAPWLRLDLSIVLPKDIPDEQTVLAELSQDFLGFVRTLKADQIAGASNLQFLKQDLQEIARIRLEGASVDVLIRTLILD